MFSLPVEGMADPGSAQDLDILMTVAGYQSITEDVHNNRKALRYNPSGVPPGPGEHAKL